MSENLSDQTFDNIGKAWQIYRLDKDIEEFCDKLLEVKIIIMWYK